MSHEALTYSFFFMGKTWNSRGLRFVRQIGSWIWTSHLQGKSAIEISTAIFVFGGPCTIKYVVVTCYSILAFLIGKAELMYRQSILRGLQDHEDSEDLEALKDKDFKR